MLSPIRPARTLYGYRYLFLIPEKLLFRREESQVLMLMVLRFA